MTTKRTPRKTEAAEPELMSIPDNVRANAKKVARDLAVRAERFFDVLLERVGLVRKSRVDHHREPKAA